MNGQALTRVHQCSDNQHGVFRPDGMSSGQHSSQSRLTRDIGIAVFFMEELISVLSASAPYAFKCWHPRGTQYLGEPVVAKLLLD